MHFETVSQILKNNVSIVLTTAWVKALLAPKDELKSEPNLIKYFHMDEALFSVFLLLKASCSLAFKKKMPRLFFNNWQVCGLLFAIIWGN